MSKQTPTFAGLRKYGLGGNIAIDVALDVDTVDFAHLIGKRVVVDGNALRCVDVGRNPHDAPWRVGEMITLIVDHGPT